MSIKKFKGFKSGANGQQMAVALDSIKFENGKVRIYSSLNPSIYEETSVSFNPVPVSTVASMTDTTKVYLYTGSETGYTAGKLYYKSGSTIYEIGTYQSSVPAISTTFTSSDSGKAADAKAVGDEFSDLKSALNYYAFNTSKNNTITIYDIEEGYYNSNNGTKQNNTSSTSYKRTKELIPATELTLYYGDVNYNAACFDKDGVFIKQITIYSYSAGNKRYVTPTGTAYIGLYSTSPSYFRLHKVDSSLIQCAEYPYSSEDYITLDNYWCNGNGNIASSTTFKCLIFGNVTAGDKYYVSNNAAYQCIFHDEDGTMISVTPVSRNVLGKIYTVPTGAVTMYVNLYKARTKGTNSEMIDYVAKLNGKSVLAIGDSITWLDGRQNYGGATYFSGWQRQLRLAGYDVINAGWSGYPYATGLDVVEGVDYSIYKEIVTNEYSVSNYDYIILFGGTNDVLHGGALGDRPSDYSNRTFDSSTFNGALGAIIDYIRSQNTSAKILIASFPKSEAVSRSYPSALSRVDELKYNADFWSCKYIDIFADMNVQPTYDGFDLYFYDTTHPNFDGMQIIGTLMLKGIEVYN